MDVPNQQHGGRGPTSEIIIVALFQLLGSMPILFICGISLREAIWVTHEIRSSPISVIILGLPFLFSCVAVVTSIGLFRLREWARRATLCLATLPLFGCVFFVIFYQPGLPASYDITKPIAEILFFILVLVSGWWWSLFTSSSVRSQFGRHSPEKPI